MPLDPSIFARFAPAPKSVQDYDKEYADAQAAQQKTQLNTLELLRGQRVEKDAQRTLGEQNVARAALAKLDPNATDDDAFRVLRGLGTQTAFNMADTYAKTASEREKSKAVALKDRVGAESERFKQFGHTATYIDTPQGAARFTTAMFNDPVIGQHIRATLGSPEEAIARIPQDPQGLEEWRQKAAMGIEGYQKQLNDQLDKKATRDVTVRGQDVAANSRIQAANISADTQRRGQNMTDARARDKVDNPPPPKPMPASAVKLQNEELTAMGTFAGLESDLGAVEKQIDGGKLKLGGITNLTNQARNFVGASNEESRNLASFKAKMENMRNTTLLLNKGVQTEGDAQRAWNELMANINDPEVVKQRLAEIRAVNRRGVDLRKANVDVMRSNFGHEPMDFSKYDTQPATVNLKAGKEAAPAAGKTVVRTGVHNGKKVVQYSDGSVDYAN